MKYLLLVALGFIFLAIIGSLAGLTFSLDFDKWAGLFVFIPVVIAMFTGFIGLCLFVKRNVK